MADGNELSIKSLHGVTIPNNGGIIDEDNHHSCSVRNNWYDRTLANFKGIAISKQNQVWNKNCRADYRSRIPIKILSRYWAAQITIEWFRYRISCRVLGGNENAQFQIRFDSSGKIYVRNKKCVNSTRYKTIQNSFDFNESENLSLILGHYCPPKLTSQLMRNGYPKTSVSLVVDASIIPSQVMGSIHVHGPLNVCAINTNGKGKAVVNAFVYVIFLNIKILCTWLGFEATTFASKVEESYIRLRKNQWWINSNYFVAFTCYKLIILFWSTPTKQRSKKRKSKPISKTK